MREKLTIAREGARMLKRNLQVRKHGFRQYTGSPTEICHSIIRECYNDKYFQVSNGHFKSFYIRDFSWCIRPLLKLGYDTQVHNTLDYCLKTYREHDRVSVAIANDRPFDFPTFAVDSLPSLIHCLKIAGAHSLIARHKDFLIKQITDFYQKVIDKSNGMVKRHKHFSSIKDHYIRNSCCYDNTMVAMLSQDLTQLGLYNPMREFKYEKLLVFTFWNGDYFIDEEGHDIISGDANIFPFWSGVISDKNKRKSAIQSLQAEGLESPYPLAYMKRQKGKKIGASIFAPGYEDNSLWFHIGSLFLEEITKISKKAAKPYMDAVTSLIDHHKNFLEVLDKRGTPYKSTFYTTDESMLWSSIYLSLCEK
ncbi:MAG: hypothetical protein ACQESG_02170 [Nanobdellota archaeon]